MYFTIQATVLAKMNAYLLGELLEEASAENKNGELEGEEEKKICSQFRARKILPTVDDAKFRPKLGEKEIAKPWLKFCTNSF